MRKLKTGVIINQYKSSDPSGKFKNWNQYISSFCFVDSTTTWPEKQPKESAIEWHHLAKAANNARHRPTSVDELPRDHDPLKDYKYGLLTGHIREEGERGGTCVYCISLYNMKYEYRYTANKHVNSIAVCKQERLLNMSIWKIDTRRCSYLSIWRQPVHLGMLRFFWFPPMES